MPRIIVVRVSQQITANIEGLRRIGLRFADMIAVVWGDNVVYLHGCTALAPKSVARLSCVWVGSIVRKVGRKVREYRKLRRNCLGSAHQCCFYGRVG